MPALETQLNARSADFQANAAAMKSVVDDLKAQIDKATLGGGEAARRVGSQVLGERQAHETALPQLVEGHAPQGAAQQ